MAYIFSKRLKKTLSKGELRVSVPRPVRRRLFMLMEELNKQMIKYENGLSFTTNELERTEERLKYEHVLEGLTAYTEDENCPQFQAKLKESF